MKKLFLLLLPLLCAACSDDEPETLYAAANTSIENGRFNGANMHFLGTSTAVDADGNAFTDAEARIEFAGGRQELVLYLHKTRFAAAMPALEMRVYTLPYTPQSGASLSFAVESIVPQVLLPNSEGGGYSYQPLPAYTLGHVEGRIDDTQCRIGFTCDVPRLGAYRVTYEGQLLR